MRRFSTLRNALDVQTMANRWRLHVGDLPPILLVQENFKDALEDLKVKFTAIRLRSNTFNSYVNGFAYVHFATEDDMLHGQMQLQRSKLLGQHTVQVHIALNYTPDLSLSSVANPLIQQHLKAHRARARASSQASSSSDSDL